MGKNKHPIECICQRAEREKQEALISQQKHSDLVRRLKAEGFSDPSMLDWAFENDNGRNPQMHHARRYVEQWQTMRTENLGLLLWGGVGTGKTFLAGCIANALMEQEVPVRMNQKIFLKNPLDCQSSATRKWSCLLSNCHRTEIRPAPSQCSTPTLDKWSAFATFLADVIEKYASVLEIDKAESLSNNENQQDAVDTTIAA